MHGAPQLWTRSFQGRAAQGVLCHDVATARLRPVLKLNKAAAAPSDKGAQAKLLASAELRSAVATRVVLRSVPIARLPPVLRFANLLLKRREGANMDRGGLLCGGDVSRSGGERKHSYGKLPSVHFRCPYGEGAKHASYLPVYMRSISGYTILKIAIHSLTAAIELTKLFESLA